MAPWLICVKVKQELRVTSSNPRVRTLKARVARLKARAWRLKARVEAIKPRVKRKNSVFKNMNFTKLF